MAISGHLKGIIPRNFLKQYRESEWFAYSSPISSFLWFFSVIPKTDSLPVVNNTIAYWLLVGLALTAIIGPMLVYYFQNRPFHVMTSWRPIEAEPIDLRLKRRGLIRLRDEEDRASVILNFYFEENVTDYKLQFVTKGPLEVSPGIEPQNAEYDEDTGILTCDKIADHEFYLPLNVNESQEDRGELERSIQVNDLTSGRDVELMNIELL